MRVLPPLLRRFWADRNGAVATDWVVLTGAVMGIGLSIAVMVTLSTTSLGSKVETALVTDGAALLGSSAPGDAGGIGTPEESGPTAFEPMGIRNLSASDVDKFTKDFGNDSDKRLNNRLNNILTKAEQGKNVNRRLDLAGIAIAEAENRGLDTTAHRARYDAFR
ncbi:MAG: hypothetical protein AAF771_12815 [Pseudomonadota bacterium]